MGWGCFLIEIEANLVWAESAVWVLGFFAIFIKTESKLLWADSKQGVLGVHSLLNKTEANLAHLKPKHEKHPHDKPLGFLQTCDVVADKSLTNPQDLQCTCFSCFNSSSNSSSTSRSSSSSSNNNNSSGSGSGSRSRSKGRDTGV